MLQVSAMTDAFTQYTNLRAAGASQDDAAQGIAPKRQRHSFASICHGAPGRDGEYWKADGMTKGICDVCGKDAEFWLEE